MVEIRQLVNSGGVHGPRVTDPCTAAGPTRPPDGRQYTPITARGAMLQASGTAAVPAAATGSYNYLILQERTTIRTTQFQVVPILNIAYVPVLCGAA